MKTTEQFGVQPHSQGPHYPAIIGKTERYTRDGALDFASWTVTLDGRTEEYATYEDAQAVALHLVNHAEARISWRTRAPVAAGPVKSQQSPAYGEGFRAYR